MTAILAIDPGSERSAWVVLDGDAVTAHGIDANHFALAAVNAYRGAGATIVIEDIEPRQQPLGREVADTLRWIGRFYQEACLGRDVHLLTRRAVTRHHIDGGTKGADGRIRAALIDRWGGRDAIRKDGPLHGIRADEWQALALAVAWQEGAR